MKKKIVVCCLLVSLALVATPLVSAFRTFEGQSTVWNTDFERKSSAIDENQVSSLGSGYLLFLVLTFTPGQGIHPYQGANVTAGNLFRSYNGTTNEKGVCVITVKAPLFREKLFFVKVSIISHDRVVSKIAFIYMKAFQIASKVFLFLVL